MLNRLIIIGAGGHGKVVADIALKVGYTDIAFIDDNVVGLCLGYPIIGKLNAIDNLENYKNDFVIAIGNNYTRRQIVEKYKINYVSLIHPSAHIGIEVKIGEGTVVMAGAIINSCAMIGNHCIINSGAIVEHDNVIEDYVHISPNVSLGGTVRICKNTHIGISATVLNNIEICNDCMIGAGAVVNKNISVAGTYIGVPAKMK